ncbi:MAG: 2-hydroxychromene-2-carboxylate isomerase [Pseudomonadota bacterium]
MTRLEFFFEFASTYSYPAAMRIEALATQYGVDVVWTPFLLGPLFHEQQGLRDSPFNVVPEKGRYMWRDMERVCAAEELPFRRPRTFPQNGLLAARCAVSLPQRERSAFARAVYRANFADGRDISDVSELAELAGLSIEDVTTRSEDPDTKQKLRENTERAKAYGIFGAPSFVTADQELFWGNDRIEQALTWACSTAERKTELA